MKRTLKAVFLIDRLISVLYFLSSVLFGLGSVYRLFYGEKIELECVVVALMTRERELLDVWRRSFDTTGHDDDV